MQLKISKGLVTLKEEYTRRIEREYKKVMYGDLEMEQEMKGSAEKDEKGNISNLTSKTKGIKLSNQEDAQDFLLRAFIEKIEINGVTYDQITQDIIDGLSVDDYNLIVKAIDKFTAKAQDVKNV